METHPDMEDSEDDSRHYTLDDAIELLPAVRDVVEKVQQICLTAGAERRAFEVLQTSRKTPIEISLAHQSLVAALWDVQPLVAWLQSKDIVLRDPSTGLIDFPSQIEGEDVFLCWRLGEDEIRYWHSTDEGFENRKRIPPGV